MHGNARSIFVDVADYYSAKLAEHGETARGVDWNGEESQTLRFEQLTKIIAQADGFALNDLGCGYGALLGYLNDGRRNFTYAGCDVSGDMIRAARARYGDQSHARFQVGDEPPMKADYGIASGIFNVRLRHSDAEWRDYLEATLDTLDRTSSAGFAFNCLTAFADAERKKDYLYYADPCELFDLCKRRYSRHVALLHDYGLYEFSILVRKQI